MSKSARPATHLCTCKFHKCNDVINPDTGQRGCLLTARTYQRHQHRDRDEALHQMAQQAQQDVLDRQAIEVTEALESLSVADHIPIATPLATPSSTDYRIDRTRRMINHISKIKDNISQIQLDAHSVGLPPPALQPTDQAIQESIRKLESLRSSVSEGRRTLAIIARQGKMASVLLLHDETAADLKSALQAIDKYKSAWERSCCQLECQRELELANGVVKYDSGKLSQVAQMHLLIRATQHIILSMSLHSPNR